MKVLGYALAALLCVSVNAAPKKHKIKIIKLKPGQAVPLALGDSYFGPVAVGRLDAEGYKAELVGLTVQDTQTPALTRKVKTVVDVSPADPMDPDQVDTAEGLMHSYYSAKRGWEENCDMGGCSGTRLVSKLTGIIYDPDLLAVDTTSCMGADLEVADVLPSTAKQCYTIRPTAIIEYAP